MLHGFARGASFALWLGSAHSSIASWTMVLDSPFLFLRRGAVSYFCYILSRYVMIRLIRSGFADLHPCRTSTALLHVDEGCLVLDLPIPALVSNTLRVGDESPCISRRRSTMQACSTVADSTNLSCNTIIRIEYSPCSECLTSPIVPLQSLFSVSELCGPSLDLVHS